MKKIENMNAKEQFSLAVRTLSNKGFDNTSIAQVMNVTRAKVGAVMAWHKHRASWGS